MPDDLRQAAHEAGASRTLRFAARTGYAANGLVHALIGTIFIVVASGGQAEADQAGAFTAIAAAPLGFFALWSVSFALGALAVYHLLEGFLLRTHPADRPWGPRVSEWGQAAAFLAVGALAAVIAVGARPDPDEAATAASRTALSLPGGQLLLSAVGIGVGAAGVVFIVLGVRRTFRSRMTFPRGAAGHLLSAIGVVGFVAKGLALAAIGVLLTTAAVLVEPEAAGGLDDAVDALVAVPWGGAVVVAIGAGLIAYGIFTVFRARFARL